MPEAVATNSTSSAPVNATSGTPDALAGGAGKADGAPAKPSANTPQKFSNKIEETLWRVNNPTADEVEDTASMDAIIDKGVADANKGSKDANATQEQRKEHVQEEVREPKKEKYKVKFGDKEEEYELDEETARRFAQKGIYYDKKNFELSKRSRDVEAREKALASKEQESAALMQAMKERSLELLVDIHGPEKARELVEGWLRPQIEREMLPPEEQKRLSIEEERDNYKRQLEERDKADFERQVSAQEQQHRQNYDKTIIQALEMEGIPKTDFTAAEMADHMLRGMNNKIEYTPQQLAQFVREDNMLRVGALTDHHVQKITEARKAGDTKAVVAAGEALMQLLGEPVMHAIGVYYINRARSNQPNGGQQPKKIMDTPKTKPDAPRQVKRMTEDQQTAKRQRIVAAMERGEQVPEDVWEREDW